MFPSRSNRERQKQRHSASVTSSPATVRPDSLYPTQGTSTSSPISVITQKDIQDPPQTPHSPPHYNLLHRNSRSTSSVPTMESLLADNTSDVFSLAANPISQAHGLGSRTTRLFSAIRRSNSYNHRKLNTSNRGMFSTPEERSVSASPITSRPSSPSRTPQSQPPSISQIAMGLHISRTPHLGPAHAHLFGSEPAASHARLRPVVSPLPRSPSPRESQTASSSTRVATPLRSSLKKSDQLNNNSIKTGGLLDSTSRSASPSISTASSATSLPRYVLSRLFATSGSGRRSRLDKFLGRNGAGRPMGNGTVSLNSSDSDLLSPRKAVRFMAVVEEGDTSRHS